MRHSTRILTAAFLFAALSPSAWGQSDIFPKEFGEDDFYIKEFTPEEKALLKRLCSNMPEDQLHPYTVNQWTRRNAVESARKQCLDPWRFPQVNYDYNHISNAAKGAPYGKIFMGCYRAPHHRYVRPGPYVTLWFQKKLWGAGLASWEFKDKVERPEDRMHLQLTFTEPVVTDDGSFSVRQKVLEFDPSRPHNHEDASTEPLYSTVFFGDEAADVMRRMYRSQTVSWTDLKTGETNTAAISERGRYSIQRILGHCGVSLHESTP